MRSTEDVRIISLNIQHGWNAHHSMLPVYVPQKKIFENLNRITKLIQDYKADIVLLQEVDQISPLTRKIDQLSYIQSQTGHQYSAYGASSELRRGNTLMYSAGCGIISRYPMTDVENVKFELSFPTPRKGFLSATLSIAPQVELTVASVHMVSFDILQSKSREGQIDRMASALAHKKAIVIGGDLNIGIRSRHMKTLLTKLNVTHHHSSYDYKHLRTFPAIKPQRRLDWILTSPHLGVSDYRTFPDRVSDHLAVGTTISL